MKLKRIICGLLAVSMLALTGCGEEKKEEFDVKTVKLTSAQVADVSSKTDKELEKSNFSGSAAITLNTNTVYNRSFGYADKSKKEKNSNKSEYQISSVTKVYTAAATAILIDEGKLKESDPLSKFFKISDSSVQKVTVKDLLFKKQDFGRYADSFITTNDQMEKYNKLVKKSVKKAETQLKKDITQFILNGGTGKTSVVGDSNYYLLGRVIEEASGMDYKDFIESRIVKKLGLKNTGFVSPKAKMTGYNVDTGQWRYTMEQPTMNSFGFMFSSFGIVSTAEDTAKFFAAIVNRTLTKTDIIREAKKTNTNFGYGFTIDGRNLHAEGRTYLHSSYVFINPENYECAVLLSNFTGNSDISTMGNDIHQVINSKINGILLEHTDQKEFGL